MRLAEEGWGSGVFLPRVAPSVANRCVIQGLVGEAGTALGKPRERFSPSFARSVKQTSDMCCRRSRRQTLVVQHREDAYRRVEHGRYLAETIPRRDLRRVARSRQPSVCGRPGRASRRGGGVPHRSAAQRGARPRTTDHPVHRHRGRYIGAASSATAHGVTSSSVTTPSSAESWSAAVAERWTRRVTASWRPSTARSRNPIRVRHRRACSGPRARYPERAAHGGGRARRRLRARDRRTHRRTDGRTRRSWRGARDLHGERPGRGPGIEFEDRGARELKGVPGKSRIFRVSSA